MQHTQRLDQRLHMLREEVRTMTHEKERGERVWRERLQRCQRQLKAKEEEMSRQSQYFENFKTQLQHKLSVAREREQTLQNRIYTLEKQLLEMTVSAATGMATVRAVRLTAGTVTQSEKQDRLPPLRGEGEGEEEKKEERRMQWQPTVAAGREAKQGGDEGKAENDIEGAQNSDAKHFSNEARLQSFIISLQEDLKVLLEREADRMTEQRGLMEQLQEAQENSHFLGCRVEEMKAEVLQLKMSESSLMEEVEELKEENHRLQQIVREAVDLTSSQSVTISQSLSTSPGNRSPLVCAVTANPPQTTTVIGPSTTLSLEKPSSEVTIPAGHHQAAASGTQASTEDPSPTAKSASPPNSDPLGHFLYFGSEPNTNFKSLSFTTESLDEFKLENWCSKGLLNLEESPSEESDALREAYRSLGLEEDLQTLQQQREHLEATLQHTRDQLRVMTQENSGLKLQLRKLEEEQESVFEEQSSREKISRSSTFDGDEQLQFLSNQDDITSAHSREDLAQALNQENRALADRIQELFAHIELREEEATKEQMQLKENISRLEEHVVRLEQENLEQEGLISELTKKTEDDLNTIMELQHKFAECAEQSHEDTQAHMEQCQRVLKQSHSTAAISGFLQSNKGECADSSAAEMLKREKVQMTVCQESNTFSADPTSEQKESLSSLSSSEKTLHNSLPTDQVAKLTTSVQSLKTEQEELTDKMNCLAAQLREVTLSVQTRTEEKQQLTRAIWGLKEEKDCVSETLAGLKQEKEQLSRTVSGLKDRRDQFVRSMSGLKEEKEQLMKSFSALERDKEVIIESLSRGKEEKDQIMQLVQSLQTERADLSQAVINLKEERDKLTNSLQCLKRQRDQEQLSDTFKEKPDRLIESVSRLKEERERTVCSKQNEKQIMLVIQGPIEEQSYLQAVPDQTQPEDKNKRLHLLKPANADVPKRTDSHVGNYTTQRCQTNNSNTGSLTQESDPVRNSEALGAQLKRSQEELDQSRAEIKRLCSELCQSETKRGEAERKATQAAEKVTRLTDVSVQMAETRMENDSLTTQVKQLQSKVTGLLREKSDILSLKAQTDERYNILTAQLKAKTVALEELNSEYIALKRGQGSRDHLGTALVSLRARYNDIRAKYDALLKRKSQTDLDIVPLKAKLSCLVAKCQERNSIIAQMMKIVQRQGFVDSPVAQWAENLLSDAALQDYTAAFKPGIAAGGRDHWAGFAPEFISTFSGYSSGFTSDQTSLQVSCSAIKDEKNGVTPGAEVQRFKSEKHNSPVPPAGLQACVDEVAPGAREKKTPNSAAGVQAPSTLAVPLEEGQITGQVSPSGSWESLEQPPSDRIIMNGPSLSPASPSPRRQISPNRRLGSPEKILNLQEQLQKTLMSSYQAPETRGRGLQPSRSPRLSPPAGLNTSSRTTKQNHSSSVRKTSPFPLASDSSQAKPSTVVTSKPAPAENSKTLFNAVVSRSASATFSPGMFTKLRREEQASRSSRSALSGSSNVSDATRASSKVELASNATSPDLTNTIPASPDVPDAPRPVPTNQTKEETTDYAESAKLETTASNTTAPKMNVLNVTAKMDGAVDGFNGSDPFCTQSVPCSVERSNKSARKSPEKSKTGKPKPGAPAEVCFVEVIKTVGQSSLMIGWERPPLDELGCSNGTFVYGYRVFVDGDFHKSVMSSACTKCVLENVDLSVLVHISVQTLGSNGLTSDSVHTTYRSTGGSDQH